MCSSEAVAQSLPMPVLARVQAEAGTPFNLLQGPLVRALLVKLGSSDHLMLLTMHHAVCDGWSFKVISTPTLSMRLSFWVSRQLEYHTSRRTYQFRKITSEGVLCLALA